MKRIFGVRWQLDTEEKRIQIGLCYNINNYDNKNTGRTHKYRAGAAAGACHAQGERAFLPPLINVSCVLVFCRPHPRTKAPYGQGACPFAHCVPPGLSERAQHTQERIYL